MNKNTNLDLLKLHNAFSSNSVIAYKGPFDAYIIKILSEKLKSLTIDIPSITKRSFTIFIELTQNVSYYSAEKIKIGKGRESGIGSLVIGESDSHIYFIIGNKVKQIEADILDKKCKIINSLDRDNLREYKRNQRNLIRGTNGGAHIGLIMISLLTSKPIDYNMIKENEDDAFFSIAVSFNKLKEDKFGYTKTYV